MELIDAALEILSNENLEVKEMAVNEDMSVIDLEIEVDDNLLRQWGIDPDVSDGAGF